MHCYNWILFIDKNQSPTFPEGYILPNYLELSYFIQEVTQKNV